MKKVMLVTGASRGIGAATALLAAQRGYAVCVNYLSNATLAEAVVDQIRAGGGQAIAVAADIASEAQVLGLFRAIDQMLGPIDVLVNNVGALQQQMPLRSMRAERIVRTLHTNVLGPMLCAREAVVRMATDSGGQGGCIVNVSSAAARLGSPNEYVDYAASKGALDTFTIGLSKEVANLVIRVNGVRPGVIYTDIHASGGEPARVDRVAQKVPMQRGGRVEEVAGAILWLASDEASYTTGALLDVAGGV